MAYRHHFGLIQVRLRVGFSVYVIRVEMRTVCYSLHQELRKKNEPSAYKI